MTEQDDINDSNSELPFGTRLGELLSRLERDWTAHHDLRRLLSNRELQFWRPLLQADYEQYWIHDHSMPVEQYLALRSELLQELDLHDDIDLLLELVETELQNSEAIPRLDEYVERFPRISADLLGRLFDARDRFGDSLSYPSQFGVGSIGSLIVEAVRKIQIGEIVSIDDTYQIQKKIGSGGNKIVYAALQTSTGRTVAMKLPIIHVVIEGVDRIVVEARMSAQLQHQNIPPVFTVNTQEGFPLFAEKLIQGESWFDRIQRDRLQLDAENRDDRPRLFRRFLHKHLEILLQICKALAYTHLELNVIHRDIKPRNVMLGKFDEVYLVDWELAVQVGKEINPDLSAPHASNTKGVVGTREYMAPEMATLNTRLLSPATDVFLLGAVLYELLTGQPPYSGNRPTEVILRILTCDFVSLQQTASQKSFPQELCSVIEKAMQIEPGQRHQNAHDFAEEIREYLRHAEAELLGQDARERYKQLLKQFPEAHQDPSEKPFIRPIVTAWHEAKSQYRDAKPTRVANHFYAGMLASGPLLGKVASLVFEQILSVAAVVWSWFGNTAQKWWSLQGRVLAAWNATQQAHQQQTLSNRETAGLKAAWRAFLSGSGGNSPGSRFSPWIEVASQFRQAARAWEQPHDERPQEPLPAGYREQLSGEAEVRWSLVRIAEQAGDFTLARDQLNELKRTLLVQDDSIDQRLRRVQRRSVVRKTLILSSLLMTVIATYAVFRQARESGLRELAESQRDRANAEVQLEQATADIATAEIATADMRIVNDFESRQFNQGALASSAVLLGLGIRSSNQSNIDRLLQTSVILKTRSSVRIPISAVCFLKGDDGPLVSGGSDGSGELRFWSRDGQLILTIPGHPLPDSALGWGAVRRIVNDPSNDQRFYSFGQDGTLQAIEWNDKLATDAMQSIRRGLGKGVQISDGGTPQANSTDWLATIDSTDTLTIWRREDLRILRQFPVGIAKASRLQVHPEGKWIAVSGMSGEIVFFNSEGQKLGFLSLPAGLTAETLPVNDLAVSPDGQYLACGRRDGIIRIWNTSTRKIVRELKGHEPDTNGNLWIHRLDWSLPTFLVSTGRDGTIRAWDPLQGKELPFKGISKPTVAGEISGGAIAVSRDGHTIVSCGSDTQLRWWDATTGKLQRSTEGLLSQALFGCTAHAMIPNANLLIAGGEATDAPLRGFDATTLREVRTFLPTRSQGDIKGYRQLSPSSISAHPAGKLFAATNLQGDLAIYDTEKDVPLFVVRDAHGANAALAAESMSQMTPFPAFVLIAVSWCADGRHVATLGFDRRIVVWKWDNDSRTLAATGHEWRDADTGIEAELNARADVLRQQLPNAADPNQLKLNLRELQNIKLTLLSPRSLGLLMEPDGNHLITFGDRIRRWEVKTGKLVQELNDHHAQVNAATFKDGLLVTGSVNGRVILWDWNQAEKRPFWSIDERELVDSTAFQALPKDLLIPLSAIYSLAFAPGMGILAVGHFDGSVGILHLQSGAVIQRVLAAPLPISSIRGGLSVNFNDTGELLTISPQGAMTSWDMCPAAAGISESKLDGNYQLAMNPQRQQWARLEFEKVTVMEWTESDGPFGQPIKQFSLDIFRVGPEATGSRPTAIQYSPDGTRLIIASHDGKAVVLDAETWKPICFFQPPRIYDQTKLERGKTITVIAVDSAQKIVATNTQGAAIDFWSLESGKLLRTYGDTEVEGVPSLRAADLKFHPTQSQLAIVDTKGTFTIIDADSLENRFRSSSDGSPDLDVGLGFSRTDRFAGPSGASLGVSQLAWMPDGSRLLQVGFGGGIVMWDALTGQRLQEVDGHTPQPMSSMMGSIARLAYSNSIKNIPGSNGFMTCGSDGTVRRWKTGDTGKLSLAETYSVRRLNSIRVPTESPLPQPPGDIANLPPGLQELFKEVAELVQARKPDTPLQATLLDGSLEILAITPNGRYLLTGGLGTPMIWLDLEKIQAELDQRRAEILLDPEVATGLRLNRRQFTPVEFNAALPPRGQ